jgi:hypothetical protein
MKKTILSFLLLALASQSFSKEVFINGEKAFSSCSFGDTKYYISYATEAGQINHTMTCFQSGSLYGTYSEEQIRNVIQKIEKQENKHISIISIFKLSS